MPGWILRRDGDKPILWRLRPGAVKTVGRTARADFILDAALVSRLHCTLKVEKSDQLVVEDLGSTNGTQVNGTRVDRAILKPGDVLKIGRVELRVERDS
jgi:pSer/pThr/pTyr-binding forkhead associated (FHA) protein